MANRSTAMFLALLVCQLAFVAANPFHKYPYVFLLDIGNEEIKKTNTEQIRLSAPGGSIAIRYPAVGTGDTIAHVRVSGIDFGTDLKANIVDGGPGYKYVVLVLIGNQGVPYDAVMSVQTVSDEDINGNQQEDDNGYNYKAAVDDNNSAENTSDDSQNPVESADDENVSAEDTNDQFYPQNVGNRNEQLTQQSSDVYSYSNRETSYKDDDDDTSDENDTNVESDTPIAQDDSDQYSNTKSEDTDYDDQDTIEEKDSDDKTNYYEDNKGNDQTELKNEPDSAHFGDDYGNDDNAEDDKDTDSSQGKDDRAYEKFQSVMPLRVYDGVRVYPQYAVPFALPSGNSVYKSDDEMGSDGNYDIKYKDNNNNDYDSNDATAIES